MRIIDAVFDGGQKFTRTEAAWQYDYGDRLRICGLKLPTAIEVHFSLSDKNGEAIRRVGTTMGEVTDVTIPDQMLENEESPDNYNIYAWIYIADSKSGNTEYKITIPVCARAKPEAFDRPEEAELFQKAIDAVNESASRAETSSTAAQSWAVGGTGTRDGEDADNAKYYAKKAQDAAEEIPGTVEAGKKDIDQYVRSKEAELKGDTGNVYFAAFSVKSGRLKMYSDPSVDKVRFARKGSRLSYRLQLK